MSPLLISIAAGVAVYVMFILLVPKAVPEEKDANIKTALDRLYEENRAIENATAELMASQLNDEPPFVRAVFSLGFMRSLHEAGVAAGFQNDLQRLLLVLAIHTAVFMLAFIGLGNALLGLLLAPLLGYMFCIRYCRKIVRKRHRKFIDQFPDALDMIVRSVKSGFPLTAALKMVAENAEEPMREEFRKIIDDVSLGRTLAQALTRLSLRVPEQDVKFFGIVLAVQQETGGNLSEVIGNLSTVLRKRKQLRHKIHAMTSEGRATGWVLGSLPIGIFLLLYIIQRDYLSPLWTEPMGHTLMMVVGALLATCFFIVKSMINIDI